MDDTSQRIFREILGRCREELVDRATDWVRERAVDLGAARPREESRALVDRAVTAQVTALLDGDDGPLEAFIESVTSLRASSEFRVSTVLRGLLSFRRALEDVLRREVSDGWTALAILASVDRVAHVATLRAADLYNEKLNHTILERRAELEDNLARLTEAKERELDEKLDTIAAQREALSALAAPVIRVWESVLVVPLIGEIDALRADVIREKVLQAVVATRARVVLVEITGLGVVDEQVASEVLRLVGCVRLLGSSAMLVGVSAAAALVLTNLDVHMDELPSFTSLHDALRSVIEEDEPQRPARSARGARARS
jgi:anti-anti-sigma regulatory factor